MNKWFPDIQIRLLDVGLATFNITYCTFPTCRHSLPKTPYLPSDSNWSSGECCDGASTIGLRDNGCWTTCGCANSRIANSRTCRLADWTSRGCHLRLCVLSFRFLAIRETASCPVRDLSSPRVDQSASWQSASWRIRELSSYHA